MSGALAIAGVTAALKDLLNDGLLNHDLSPLGSFSVTAQAPDRINTGNNETNLLNVFLYQVTPNLGWRNADLPSRDGRGQRTSNPPLALDLHYLVTAYGTQDLNAEILLGYAMQLLHETPMLTRQQLRTVLGAPPPVDGDVVPGIFGTLSAEDLADQVELIKIAPNYLGADELSKLWTAMQARWRPSMVYIVSVVLIQANGPVRAPLPVLQRGPGDRGPTALAAPAPVLQAVRNALSPLWPALQLGDDALLVGSGLQREATLSAAFDCGRLGITLERPLTAGNTPAERRVHLPTVTEDGNAAADWGIGVYTVSLRVTQAGQPTWSTNAVPIALAPRISASPLNAAPGDPIDLVVDCVPRLRPLQHAGVRLLLAGGELVPASIDTPGDPAQPTRLHFNVPGQAAGAFVLRLRVDGIDSLPVRLGGTPPRPEFDPGQTLQVA
ncbi:DUF4255 domain-containing protein [Ideonella sp. YS5]|uniref:DUF4255 domain-containing protein n=1 Tax=Ideonella sp. YS5 TaxID=3453714 RepID=UPI003EEB7198